MISAANSEPRFQPDGVINAYVEGWELVLVLSDASMPSGIRLRRIPAEHSCLVKISEVPELLRSMLRESTAVRGLREEGEWLRIRWRDSFDCRKYCKLLVEKSITTYDGFLDPILRFMADNQAKVAARRLCYFDLESDSRVPFSRLHDARILSWALVCSDGSEIVEVLSDDTEAAERELLRSLWNRLDKHDQVAAWNGDKFDFPLLKARSEHHAISVPWKRWLWLDHLELFRKMNAHAAESGAEKQSFSLGAIAKAILGESKGDVDGSKTWQTWAAGGAERERLADYNLRDAQLMKKLEDKTGYVALLGSIAEVCGSFPDSRGMMASVQVENLLQRLAVQRGFRFETPIAAHKVKGAEDSYRGAYVMEPAERGIVKNVHVADFSSLYPTIIRTWNMSPETKTRRSRSEREIDSSVRHGSKPWPFDGECISPITGVVFKMQPQGMLSGAVAEMMRLRKESNDRKARSVPGTAEWQEAARKSDAYKIAANSCYGAIGMTTFRHHDVEVAESVSQAAVWLIRQTIEAADKRGLHAIYCDTDSVFVSGCTREEFADFVAWCNAELYPRLLRLLGCEPGLINLAYEKAFERIVFVQKKRYCGRYSHYKGTAATSESKPEVKGLEYKRGDSIRLARQLQEEAVDLLVGQEHGGNEDPEIFKRLLERWRERVLVQPLELADVVVVKGLNKPINSYAKRIKKDGMEARQLPHIEVAKILTERGREITEGSRIGYVIIDGSTNPQTVIPAEDWSGKVDRSAAWESLVAPPTIRVLEAAFPAIDWKPFEIVRTKEQKAKARKAARANQESAPVLFESGQYSRSKEKNDAEAD